MYKYEQCKLCFYRGGSNCYEQSYVDGVFSNIKYINVNIQYQKGCKKMRKGKILKLMNKL